MSFYPDPNNNQQYGYGYGVARPKARNTQPLTQEQIAALRNSSDGFDMKVTKEELWAAACTHKELTGQSALRQNEDGSFTCSICHKTFNMVDADRDTVAKLIKDVIDMLQTCKTIYVDAPAELIEQYFQMIVLLEKFGVLWDHAMRDFSQYDNAYPMTQYPIGYSGFNALNALMTNPYAYMPGVQPGMQPGMVPQQPMQPGMPQQQFAQPVYPQQPMQQPMYGMPGNPVAYGTPVAAPAPAPVAPAPGVMPGGNPAAVPATQQPEVQQQQVFNV